MFLKSCHGSYLFLYKEVPRQLTIFLQLNGKWRCSQLRCYELHFSHWKGCRQQPRRYFGHTKKERGFITKGSTSAWWSQRPVFLFLVIVMIDSNQEDPERHSRPYKAFPQLFRRTKGATYWDCLWEWRQDLVLFSTASPWSGSQGASLIFLKWIYIKYLIFSQQRHSATLHSKVIRATESPLWANKADSSLKQTDGPNPLRAILDHLRIKTIFSTNLSRKSKLLWSNSLCVYFVDSFLKTNEWDLMS